MKYILTTKERRKQANFFYQIGKFFSLSLKFMKLVAKTH